LVKWFGGGLILGILVSLFSLINNLVINSLLFGLFTWIGIVLLFIGVGFTSEEYFKRKKRIEKLNSGKYSFLDDNNFSLHQDLYFEGEYKGFWARVLPMNKWVETKRGRGKDIDFVAIECLYTFESDVEDGERENRMCGNYFLGQLNFTNHCVGFIPKDWENPVFKENFDGLISIFNRENLKPLSKNNWEETYGLKMKNDKLNEEKSRTKQILKIGKLDIKIIKSGKKVSR
jgi:hypothetical protein